MALASLKVEKLTAKILRQNYNSHKGVELWAQTEKHKAIFPARHPRKSSQHVRACAAGDGTICSKNRKLVPYHGANPNTRNGARLRSPSPIMAPAFHLSTVFTLLNSVCYLFLNNGLMRTPKRQNILSLVFTCLCISTALIIK